MVADPVAFVCGIDSVDLALNFTRSRTGIRAKLVVVDGGCRIGYARNPSAGAKEHSRHFRRIVAPGIGNHMRGGRQGADIVCRAVKVHPFFSGGKLTVVSRGGVIPGVGLHRVAKSDHFLPSALGILDARSRCAEGRIDAEV